jgi:cytoskeleton protein RodZ
VYREATGESAKPERPQSILRSGPSRRAGPLVISLVLFIALGASLFALRLGLKSSPPSAPATSASARGDTASVPSSASIPAATAPVIQTQPVPVSAADAKPAAQRLVIHAVEPTWIRVQVDDGQVSEELLPAGAGREWTAARRFVLTVGNAGGLEIDLNGKRMPALGARGAVIQKLVLPPEAQGTGS